jgi:cell division protease FtsH
VNEPTVPGPETLPSLHQHLRDHFGGAPSRLPVVEQSFDDYHRPNLHLAVTDLLAGPDAAAQLLGVVVDEDYREVSLPKLSLLPSASMFHEGPVEYADVDLADSGRLACVKRGLYLFRDGGRPLALLVRPNHAYYGGLHAAVMAPDREAAEAFSRRLTRAVRHGAAYRGQVLSLEVDCHGRVQVKFHPLPHIRREDVVLPEDVLGRIERQAVGFTRHAERLRAAGRHLKRGILLHGRPGTGKTLSAMYLASLMPGRTVLVLTGATIGAIETACGMARLLVPSTVILEDVDLIGTQREHQTVGANALLFELLNQMDGLAEDADVLFVLTTNRPDELEPALAARPGRVDLALEVPLPDAECRRRLIELYGRGLPLRLAKVGRWVERTAGASGAFIREMLRKAALLAADEAGDGEFTVTDKHVEEALAELLVAGGPLTKMLLGVAEGGPGREKSRGKRGKRGAANRGGRKRR